MNQTTEKVLLEVKNLKTWFFTREGTYRAVDGISFILREHEVLGIVGESGCGKSVTAYSILRLLSQNARIVEGKILLHLPDRDVDLTSLNPKGSEIRRIRGKEISMIFQEPMTSFSPVHTIGNQIQEAIMLHQRVGRKEAKELAIRLLAKSGIPKPEMRIDNYPHQLSGGMRQRAMIAMALSCNPRLLIADEPTTALDVTIQAQILDLIKQLQEETGASVMMITHNLGVIAEMASNVIVMYLGKIVEQASVTAIFQEPKHPYTKSLMASIPKIGKTSGTRLASIKGIVPDASNIPPGCPYHPRCMEARIGICDREIPEPRTVSADHTVSCLKYQKSEW
jgi:peptide/nickel transport system ATP-binding protein